MSGIEILLTLVAVFAAGRVVARWRDSRSGRGFRRSGFRRQCSGLLLVMAAVYGFGGCVCAFRSAFSLLTHPDPALSDAGPTAVMSAMCFLFAWFLLWLGVRIRRGGGLTERLARAARAACREFLAPTDSVAKPKPDPAAQLLD